MPDHCDQRMIPSCMQAVKVQGTCQGLVWDKVGHMDNVRVFLHAVYWHSDDCH